MKKIKLSQNQVALIDNADFEYLNIFKWHAIKGHSTFYAIRNIRLANGRRTTILMHREILNPSKGIDIDHINHCGLDNRRTNLRICTCQENKRNGNSYKNSSSIFKGVSWHKNNKKWRADIRYNRKTKYLGCFLSETDAALAYNNKAIELFGEFAKLNEIIK